MRVYKEVVKRDGRVVPFDQQKIEDAITQAWNQIGYPDFDSIANLSALIANEVSDRATVREIENTVMSILFQHVPDVAREYCSYKMERERARKHPNEIEKVLLNKSDISQENANKDTTRAHIMSAYLAEIPSKQAMRDALPKDCLEAHDANIVYFHDMAYSIRPIENCRLLDLDCLLQNGFELNGIWIEKPKSFLTACTVATQVLTHVTGSSYGGCTINLLHLAKFVDVSRQKIRKEEKKKLDRILDNILDKKGFHYEEVLNKNVNERLQKEISQGIQTFTYQNQTLCSGIGQAVFLTVSVYLNEDKENVNDLILVFKEMLKQRIQGVKTKDGTYENLNFPKILYFLDEDTMKGGKYYDITVLCAECSAKRLVPDYMSVKKHMEIKGVVTPSMGCRALLSPWRNPKTGELQTWGRANIGVQSLNLPYIAMLDNPNRSIDKFFDNLDKYLQIAYRDMLWRINHVSKIKAKTCPVLWVYGGVAKLNPEDTLYDLVHGGFYTCTLGYMGLYECVKYLTGHGHWEEENGAKNLANKILDYLNEQNEIFGYEVNVSIALYGTPAETLTDKFAKACVEKFGHVGDGTVRDYLTNSYHIPVFKNTNAFDKLSIEAEFSDKTAGGSISYVELPNMSNNIEAVLELIEHIGDTCLYAELNSEISTCGKCGFNGYDFPKVFAEDGTIRWKCPRCGETDPEIVHTSYRICGYISNYTPNQGRSQDIKNRVKHLNLEES